MGSLALLPILCPLPYTLFHYQNNSNILLITDILLPTKSESNFETSCLSSHPTKMCKEEHPLSIVRALGDALSLNPIATPPTPDSTQTDPERTPEQISTFHTTYLPILMRTGIPTAQDVEEMRLRGLTPIPEEYVQMAREHQARQLHEQQSRQTQPPATAPVPWLLDEDRRFAEPEEYDSEPGLPTDDVGNVSFDLPAFESVLPITPVENRPPGLERTGAERGGVARGPLLTRLPGTGGLLRSAASGRLQEEMGAVGRVGSEDARIEEEGYQRLGSGSPEGKREEGEVQADELEEGEREERIVE